MGVDCIIIGYNHFPMFDVLGGLEITKDLSGAYDHLAAQSVVLKSKRCSYSELIQECISQSTGKQCELDIFKMPIYAVHYLVNFLRKVNLSAEPINYFNAEKERLIELLGESPKAVVISTSFYINPEPVKEIVEFIRSYNKETNIIVGGPYIANLCFEMDLKQQNWLFKDMGADIYINDLQGELTLSKLCQELKKDIPDFSEISNLIYKVGKEFCRTPREKEDNRLDYNYVNCYSFDENKPIPAVFVRTSRSCSNQCAFCRYPFLGGKYTIISLESVEEELDYLHSIGVRYLVFVDDTFNIPLARYKDLLRMLIRKQYNFKWFSFFRCSDADDETYDLMAEAGCTGVFLGIESGDPGILINMNKKATIDQYRHGIETLNSKGIMTMASCMIGFPGETEETVANTIKFIQETKPTFYSLQMYFHETKVPIADKADIYGITGGGYSWCHNTMDWKTASKLVYEGHQNIKESIFLPIYDFQLWSICYYMSQGVIKEELCEFLKLAKEMMLISSLDSDPTYTDGQDKKILSVFKNSKIGIK
ncbi:MULTISPECIES: PhpK family radical SAM P-methyltransferase [unclassified Clostridium]|uniref:PhpK family radical SAM P-methyltransferase n=1 Tax=unclassified Clostridium TaxID=2614128 RepID=UPI0025BDACF1|nr:MULTISPECIES: PhpK family radical SAM P-methyltransferase [unclassified Clostridium]